MSITTVDALEEKALQKKWFYEFTFPSGRQTELYIPPEMAVIHTTRLQMLDAVIEPLFGDRWRETTAIDIACHEGYFSTFLAGKYCKKVLGIDTREEHVTDASLIRDIYGYKNLDYRVGDVRTMDATDYEPADIVLVFGLLYHLENPVQAIRLASQLTRNVCIIETQITPNITGIVDWGACTNHREIQGTFSIIDETEETDKPEASISGISVVPSKEALFWLFKHFGFKRIEVVPVPAGGYEQLVSGNRVVIAAYRD